MGNMDEAERDLREMQIEIDLRLRRAYPEWIDGPTLLIYLISQQVQGCGEVRV